MFFEQENQQFSFKMELVNFLFIQLLLKLLQMICMKNYWWDSMTYSNIIYYIVHTGHTVFHILLFSFRINLQS